MKKVIYKDWDIEITVREILVSIAIFLSLSGIGCLIYGNIDNKDKVKEYETAQIIHDDKGKLDYLVNTKFGNVIAYSTFKTDDKNFVTFEEIDSKYSFIKRVKQKYTMHTRTVCSGSGKSKTCRTETYWTWDNVDIDRKYAKNINFMGYRFEGKKLLDKISNDSLKLSKKIYKGKYKKINGKYVYESSHIRYYYEYIPINFKASIFSNTRDKEVFKEYTLFYKQTPEQAIESIKTDNDVIKICFIVIWIFIMLAAICGYVKLDNDYLED